MAKATYIENHVNVTFDILLQTLRNAQINITNDLILEYERLSRLGLNQDEINNRIFQLVETKINEIGNKEAQELFQLFKTTSQATETAGLRSGMYRWTRNAGAKGCKDCLGRDGQIDTLANWESRGLPQSGTTQCDGNCMCELIPAK